MRIGSSRFVRLAFAAVIGIAEACGSSSGIIARAPAISGFSPHSGPVGAEVRIIGVNFDASAANDTVKLNGVEAKVTSASTTTLAVLVPSDATTGVIAVTVAGSTAATVSPFAVTKEPASGAPVC